MRERVIIDPSYPRPYVICQDVRTWLQRHTPDQWKISENDDFDGRTVITVSFIDSIDAAEFRQWRSTVRHILRR
jgi:hypothetical protein